MLLSLCSINLFGQNPIPTDSLVVIDISTIRRANEKLIELNHLKEVVINQNDIISDYKIISEKQDSLIYKYQIKNITLENEFSSIKKVNESLNKNIKTRNTFIAILGGATTVSLITTIICLFKN